MWNTITILILVTVKSSGNYSFSLSKNILTKIIDITEMRHILGTVGPCIVRPKYPKKGVYYAKPHYVKPHYKSAWIV